MENKNLKPYLLEPAFKLYSWGSYTAIQNMTGRKELEGKTAAEMWMGDHPSGLNSIKEDSSLYPLHNLVESYPEKLIGKSSHEKFPGTIPFLLKVLGAEKPLSIQSHPDKKQAEEGFERENILNIGMKDFNRGYKDRNHKPEIILALTPFKMMKGFRRYEKIKENFSLYCPESSEMLFFNCPGYSEEKNIKSFFKKIMSAGRHDSENMINEALSAINKGKSEDNDKTVSEMIKKFSEYYPGDPGILSPLYLNCAVLSPGDAVYIPAGELHAYIEGTGIELMANSDNVFRGGLTAKHVDREELYKILRYRPTEIKKIEGKKEKGETFFFTESEEFLLSEIVLDKDKKYNSAEDRNIDILICCEGSAEVLDSGGCRINVSKGESFLVPSSTGRYSIIGEGVFYKATVPK